MWSLRSSYLLHLFELLLSLDEKLVEPKNGSKIYLVKIEIQIQSCFLSNLLVRPIFELEIFVPY